MKITRLAIERYKAEFNEPIAQGLSKMINTALEKADWKMIINIESFCNFLTYEEQKTALHNIFFVDKECFNCGWPLMPEKIELIGIQEVK